MNSRLQVVLAADVRRADGRRRRRRNFAWRMFAAIEGPWLVRSMYRGAMARAQRSGTGLYLHPRWLHACLGEHLDVDIPPVRISRVLPDWLVIDGVRRHTSDHALFAGDWRGVLRRIETTPVHREAIELAAHAMDYRSTAVYADMVARVDRGEATVRQHRRLRTRADVDAYFERFVALFASIRVRGLLRHGRGAARDVGIALGPHGEPVRLPGGQHRLAIAQALELPAIPVQIRMLHTDFIARVAIDLGVPRNDIAAILTRTLAGSESAAA